MLTGGSAARQDFDLYAGRDVTLSFPVVDAAGGPYVFENTTRVSWWLGLDKASPLVSKSSSVAGEITIVGSEVQVRIYHADTSTLKASSESRVYKHELEIVDPNGNKFSACIGTPTVFSTFDQ
jgi:hypothetical protein